jgi:hypothetical protein
MNPSTPGSGSSRCSAGLNRPQGCGNSRPADDREVFRLHVMACDLIRPATLLSPREVLAGKEQALEVSSEHRSAGRRWMTLIGRLGRQPHYPAPEHQVALLSCSSGNSFGACWISNHATTKAAAATHSCFNWLAGVRAHPHRPCVPTSSSMTA